MIFRTHIAFALLIGLWCLDKFDGNKWLFLLIVLLSVTLPDIDHPRSKIGRQFGKLSKLLNFVFGHRRWIHSIFVPIILSIIIRNIFGDWWMPFFIGYFSHLLMDGFTLEGINFIYPFKQLRLSGFIETGKREETVLFWIFVVLYIFINMFLV